MFVNREHVTPLGRETKEERERERGRERGKDNLAAILSGLAAILSRLSAILSRVFSSSKFKQIQQSFSHVFDTEFQNSSYLVNQLVQAFHEPEEKKSDKHTTATSVHATSVTTSQLAQLFHEPKIWETKSKHCAYTQSSCAYTQSSNIPRTRNLQPSAPGSAPSHP